MKCFPLFLSAVAVVCAAADSLSTYIPKCAVGCLTTAIDTVTSCKGPEDLECFCIADNYRAIYDSGVACVLQACGNDVSVGEVLPAAARMCEEVTGAGGKPVTSVGSLTTSATTPGPAAASTTSSSPSPSTSINSNSRLRAHFFQGIAPLVLGVAVNV
ncbi:uncharacterized protein B0H64DRAFT_137631 [Chaetomium fimeti]|uniref:CFEM domain-containing protein n=1 Tax=Chaetomium fimeti TaxID=1854472 RepID=A0AAE0HKC9_9PEZI|nr:hypothetical protein B0H64DRAFT_137631 [Chaetomium fimeti]